MTTFDKSLYIETCERCHKIQKELDNLIEKITDGREDIKKIRDKIRDYENSIIIHNKKQSDYFVKYNNLLAEYRKEWSTVLSPYTDYTRMILDDERRQIN